MEINSKYLFFKYAFALILNEMFVTSIFFILMTFVRCYLQGNLIRDGYMSNDCNLDIENKRHNNMSFSCTIIYALTSFYKSSFQKFVVILKLRNISIKQTRINLNHEKTRPLIPKTTQIDLKQHLADRDAGHVTYSTSKLKLIHNTALGRET